jgi:tRNA G18 (ribose-2'-O)-methylase SpoU
MLQIRTITTFEDPALVPYQTMRRHEEHKQQNIFVAEGEKVVRRLLESHFQVVSVVLPPHWLEPLRPLLESRSENIQVFLGEKKLLESLTGFSMYQGLLAVGRIPASPSLETILAHSQRPRFFVAVDGLTSADNLGVVVRNCAAFGVQALIIGETTASPYLRRGIRSSMGTIFKLPVVEVENLSATLFTLRNLGVRLVAAHPHVEGRTLYQANLKSDCCVVLGSEGEGIRPKVLSACDEAVAVPMHLGVDSLNVGSAAAVFLYEVTRQRWQSELKS